MDKEAFGLLKSIETSLKTVENDIREIKTDLKAKVEVKDFDELKDRVKVAEEKNQAIQNKWWFSVGIATTLTQIIGFLK